MRTPILILFLVCILSGTAQEGPRKDAWEFNKRLGRGINFMAVKINNGYHDPLDFQLTRYNKFTHIRIGSRVWQYVGEAPDYTIEPEKIDSYQLAVDWALDHQLMVMMDPIHGWKEYEDTDLPKLKKLWEQLATRFASYPVDSIAFELFNEPWSYDFDLEAMIKGCIDIIRSIPGNEERIIVVSGQSFSTRQALIDAFNNNIVFPTDDPYLIGTFHYYDPRPFTKQGEAGDVNWADDGDDDPEWEETINKFQEVVEADNNWAERNNTEPLPIYNGEYGVDNGAPWADRTRWLWWVRMVSEQMGFSHAIWNLYNDSPTAKGMGPWTDLQKEDPTTRYLHQDVLNRYRNRYECENGLLNGPFNIEVREDSSNDSLVSVTAGESGNNIMLSDVYIAKSGTYDVTLRFQNNDTGAVILTLASGTDTQMNDSLSLELQPSGEAWHSVTVPLSFATGEDNRIMLRLGSTATSLLLDYLAVTKGVFYDNLYPSEETDVVFVGITEQQKTKVLIYPNPATATVHISGEFRHWDLYSISGTRIVSGSEHSFPVDYLDPGFYFLQVDNTGYKLIVK